MRHECTRCGHRFTSDDLVRPFSRNPGRKAAKPVGVRFSFYHCPECGTGDIFADVLPLDGETPVGLRRRKAEMESAIQYLHDVQPDATDSAATDAWPLRPSHIALPSYSTAHW